MRRPKSPRSSGLLRSPGRSSPALRSVHAAGGVGRLSERRAQTCFFRLEKTSG
jgi:hypothetical protein